MKGVIQESSTSQKYKSSKGLDLEDILYTANVAKLYTNFDKQVWLDYSNCKGWKQNFFVRVQNDQIYQFCLFIHLVNLLKQEGKHCN